jgi:hypothetical protein
MAVEESAGNARSVTWVYLDGFTTERDSASAFMVSVSCPEVRGTPITASRHRIRLRREGSGWVLAGIDAEERVRMRCRDVLRATWESRPL